MIVKSLKIRKIKKFDPIEVIEKESYQSEYQACLIGGDPKKGTIDSAIIGSNPKLLFVGTIYKTSCFDIETQDLIDEQNIPFCEYVEKFKNDFISQKIGLEKGDWRLAKWCGIFVALNYEYAKVFEEFSFLEVENEAPVVYGLMFENILYQSRTESLSIDYEYALSAERSKRVLEKNKPFEFNMVSALISKVNKANYVKDVKKTIHHIYEGDVYQLNYSSEYSSTYIGDPIEFYKKILKYHPTPYSAFLNFGKKWILCSSMESFIHREKETISTSPIKGTASKVSDSNVNKNNIQKLKESAKENAELSMIVDLLRNDISKVCLPESVDVIEHRKIEEYKTLYHTVSQVIGTLNKNTTNAQIIKAMFPGGSITGCPKRKAMQIIKSLEKRCRNIYTGSIGFYSFFDHLNLNIAIRTIWGKACNKNKSKELKIASGGGIVYDSNPESEYLEHLQKIKWFENCLSEKTAMSNNNGFFETILVKNNVPIMLDMHLQRLNNSLEKKFRSNLFNVAVAREQVSCFLSQNTFDGYQRLNIYAQIGFDITFRISPLDKQPFNNSSLNLSFIGNLYKTGEKKYNYKNIDRNIYSGLDNYVIGNDNNEICETSVANIFLIKDQNLFTPHLDSPCLDGIIRKWIMKNFSVIERRIKFYELNNFDYMFLTNSLRIVGEVKKVEEICFRPINESKVFIKIKEKICKELLI